MSHFDQQQLSENCQSGCRNIYKYSYKTRKSSCGNRKRHTARGITYPRWGDSSPGWCVPQSWPVGTPVLTRVPPGRDLGKRRVPPLPQKRPGTRDWGTPPPPRRNLERPWKGPGTGGCKGTWDQGPGYPPPPVDRQTRLLKPFRRTMYAGGNKGTSLLLSISV